MIELHRSRLENDCLTIGRIYWSDDVEEFARRSKSAFEMLKTWIRTTWRKQGNYYVGTGASTAAEQGVRLVGLGIPITRIDPKAPRS